MSTQQLIIRPIGDNNNNNKKKKETKFKYVYRWSISSGDCYYCYYLGDWMTDAEERVLMIMYMYLGFDSMRNMVFQAAVYHCHSSA